MNRRLLTGVTEDAESHEKSRFGRVNEEYCFGHVRLKIQVKHLSAAFIKYMIL